MNSSPKVSIVIPVYNGSNYLREAIDSALAQTYKNIEVIVINDGSSDEGKTEAIAKSYGNEIKYYCKKNGGVASALNLGIKKMVGAYFSWLSHDDVYYPNKIERQIKYLSDENKYNFITYCDCHIIDENSNIIRATTINKKYLKNIYLTILSTSIGGCSLLIPKLCFETVGYFNEKLKYTQDNEMWLRIAKAGFDFKYGQEILLKTRIHSKQESNVFQKAHEKEKREFYTWAVHYIGNDLNNIYDDMARIFSNKKLSSAYNKLLKIRCGNNILARFYNLSRFQITLFFSLIIRIIKKSHIYSYVKKKLDFTFFNSSKYWESRYLNRGTSGVGSYGKLALYKAEVINSFVKENNIKNVIDFGCGDGNQTALYDIPKYIGLDVSKTAIKICKQKFRDDPSKQFFLYNSKFLNKNNKLENADLTLSIDVLFHLVEYDIFLKYINDLFYHSDQYVMIYSTNFNQIYSSPHQIDRKFTSIIEREIKNFKLFEVITNPYKGKETMSDFFIYKKIR